MKLQSIKLNLIAQTNPLLGDVQYSGTNKLMEQYNLFSGLIARNCVTTKPFAEIMQEDSVKSFHRAESIKESGHHSVFDHEYLTFEISNLSKAFAMILNNEKAYNTTEKSMRYTVNYENMTSEERVLYSKWLSIFQNLIADKYQNAYPAFFTDVKIKKLAQENARYLLSIYSPTSMIYTSSIRNLNYMHKFLCKELEKIESGKSNAFYAQLKPSFQNFNEELEKLGIIDEKLAEDYKNRTLSLYSSYEPAEVFSDVYSTNYNASLACLAQAQRHRTINYSFTLPNKTAFYVPPILTDSENLTGEWLADCQTMAMLTSADISQNITQANLVRIHEQGTMDNFILKLKERKCTYAQLEINNQVNQTLHNYLQNLQTVNHPRTEELASYSKGARCTFKDYNCTNRCNFIEGITETRQI